MGLVKGLVMRLDMGRLVCCVVTSLGLLVGCGKDADTKFGATDDVRAYRSALNPLIEEVSAIEREVGERAVGADSVAIDSRIVPVYLELQPRLLAVQQTLAEIRPPRKLANMHDDINMLVQLRLDAYQIVIDGFAAGDISVYAEAVGRLAQANALILDINGQLCEVDVELDDRDDCRLLAVHTSSTPSGADAPRHV
ncbi:MAG: hypothetical protein O2782_04665 [bacterium]|nr:hypothetical protein [bacterium]